ncbi:hypothetical protein BZM26_00875 [Paraburkholderia strydomiana]|nr:hypothetical protein BZM26_00875 [Paraburkholderia strydomiana]
MRRRVGHCCAIGSVRSVAAGESVDQLLLRRIGDPQAKLAFTAPPILAYIARQNSHESAWRRRRTLTCGAI